MRFGAPMPDTRAGPFIRLRHVLRPHRRAPSPGAALLMVEDDRVPGNPAPGAPSAAANRPPESLDALAQIPANFSVAPSPDAAHPALELAVHLLGPLYVAVDDVAVEDWSSARSRSLFGYLLTHREPWPAREVLMEAFWPESSPEASRNSLNVAIHGVRRTLRTVTEMSIVVYASGTYRLSRDLRLWLDVEEFESRLESARRFEDAGEIDKAIRDYESAGGLYRGDFMADDPYEDWAALTRERLRQAHLDALGRLSNLYFKDGQYTACANLCQRIIETDPCREDAHRRLMCCYSRQGQPHLALMQYRVCLRALADELGAETDPATTELHQRIRRHERV